MQASAQVRTHLHAHTREPQTQLATQISDKTSHNHHHNLPSLVCVLSTEVETLKEPDSTEVLQFQVHCEHSPPKCCPWKR